jgi:hypothetical protein
MSEISKAFGRSPERELLTQTLEEIRAFRTSTTEFASRFFGQTINQVLSVEHCRFPSNGYITRSYPATAGVLVIDTLAPADWDTGDTVIGCPVTYVVGGASGSPPTAGIGVIRVSAWSHAVINLSSTTFTLYGTPDAFVNIQVLSKGGLV